MALSDCLVRHTESNLFRETSGLLKSVTRNKNAPTKPGRRRMRNREARMIMRDGGEEACQPYRGRSVTEIGSGTAFRTKLSKTVQNTRSVRYAVVNGDLKREVGQAGESAQVDKLIHISILGEIWSTLVFGFVQDSLVSKSKSSSKVTPPSVLARNAKS